MRTATGYLERYQAGEREQVWEELRALGPAVHEEPVWSDARLVAAETMRRAHANVALLVERLDALGYRFAARERTHPRPGWAPATAESRARLAICERMYGALPLSLHAWHSVVGAVDFTGTHPRLNPCRDPLMDAGGQVPHTAPLVVYPCAEESIRHVAPDRHRAEAATMGAQDAWDEMKRPCVALALAPDAQADGGAHGGESAILLPNSAADAAPAWGEWKDAPFVTYLRICFAWGGFPGLMGADEAPREELAYLRRGLLPL